MRPVFSPSLVCMDLLNIKEQFQIPNTRVDLYHVDITDGHYVKNTTLSLDSCKTIHPVYHIPLDCRLMVTTPDGFIEPLAKVRAGFICLCVEAINTGALRTVNKIRSLGYKVSIVLNPAAPVPCIQHYVHLLDEVTVMTVDPGFAEQPFIREMLDKVNELKVLKGKGGYKHLIEVGGPYNGRTFGDLTKTDTEVLIVDTSDLPHLDPDLATAWDEMMGNFNKAVSR